MSDFDVSTPAVDDQPQSEPEVSEAVTSEADAEQVIVSPIQLEAVGDRWQLQLPSAPTIGQEANAEGLTWLDLQQHLQQLLQGRENFWEAGTELHLYADSWLLDGRQLEWLSQQLDRVALKLTRITTQRRQTAVAAVSLGLSIEQPIAQPESWQPKSLTSAIAAPLYLKRTLRSGAEVRHNGSVIVVGDVNPGSSIVASGDILVWGNLRGIAHAGAAGNLEATIFALSLAATQLRIGDRLARLPSSQAAGYPEVAQVIDGQIQIRRADPGNK
ncbi:septum site-determining protein MinC [Synechococcus elongatus]|uniref:Probable septum site-determining protein MinC n=1 Tax=Synechococcus elongatus PCC 11801 TaxID=2219813 RepID=A0AAN1UUB3_SYNEL|nr:septum site-determining protein MinC [Synechococcus elongatus]AZB72391.1 septum site-determining protein MinC [Synechococcus elongatus PCC 11801]